MVDAWLGALGPELCDPEPGGEVLACLPYLGTFALRLQGLGGVRKGFWFIEFRPQICWLCRVNSTLSTKGH